MNLSLRWLVAAVCVGVLGMLPSVLTAQNVRSFSTGVSIDERVPHKDYSLLLIFANKKGELLANVDVIVKDKDGKAVVTTNSPGPWLFLGLPAGEYTVTAQIGKGKATGSPATVPATGQQRIVVRF